MEANESPHPRPVKVGNVVVRIYRYRVAKANKTYHEFKVADFTSGKRKFHSFSSLMAARNKAKEIGEALVKGEVDALTLTGRDKAVYLRACELLEPTGIPLELAAGHFAEAFKVLGSDRILEAARHFSKVRPAQIADRPVHDVVDELIADAKSRGLSKRYVKTMRHYCCKFANAFSVPIHTVTAAEVREFLDGLGVAPRSRNNHLASIRTLFSFAKERDYLPNDFAELDKIKPVADDEGEIEIFTPEEIHRLLKVAPPEILPCLAIGAFAGLRSAEVERLRWEDIKFESGYILVRNRAEDGQRNKTGKRTVPLLPNLLEWLGSYKKASGPVWMHTHDGYYQARKAMTAATETKDLPPVQWKVNGLRHSFISYRVQSTQNLPQVALECGNSVRMILKHYREVEMPDGRLVTPEIAKEWFGITPKSKIDPNVIRFPEAASAS